MARIKKPDIFKHSKMGAMDVIYNFHTFKHPRVLFSKSVKITVPPDGTFCDYSDHKIQEVPKSYIVSFKVGKVATKDVLLHCLFFKINPEDIGKEIVADCEVIEIIKNDSKTIHLKLSKYGGQPKDLHHMTILTESTVKKTESFILPQARWARINFVKI